MATEVIKIVDPDNGSGTHYTSLSAWEAGEQRNLVSADEIATAKCRCTGGTADTTAFTIADWTTDDSRYIKIWTDPSEGYRHDGVFPASGTKYRLKTPNSYYAIICYSDHVRFDGIASTDDTNTNGIFFYGYSYTGNDYRFTNCILKNQTIAVDAEVGGSPDVYVVNCIIHSHTYAPFFYMGTNTHWYIFNTTVASCSFGIYPYTNATVLCINVISHNDTEDFHNASSGTITCYNCLSKDGSADDYDGSDNRINKTLTFNDSVNGDFSLASSDIDAINYGLNLSESDIYAFSDDIVGNDRNAGDAWDIGASELTIAKSIKIVDPDNGSGTHYTSLSAWEAGEQRDLVTANEIAIATCRCTSGTVDNTSNGNYGVAINGWTTDAARYIKIWCDPAESYRHDGVWDNSKYRLYISGQLAYAIIYLQVPYVWIDGLQIKSGSNDGYTANGISATSDTDYIKVSNSILVYAGSNNVAMTAVSIDGSSADPKLWNNLVYDWTSGLGAWNQNFYIYNNTIVNCSTGLEYGGGGNTSQFVLNNLVYDCTTPLSGYSKTFSYNSTDGVWPSYKGEITNGNRENQLFSFNNPDADDYHLKKDDTGAKNYGTNLYNDSYITFQNDIAQNDRGGSGAIWDIGAFECVLSNACTRYGFSLIYLL